MKEWFVEGEECRCGEYYGEGSLQQATGKITVCLVLVVVLKIKRSAKFELMLDEEPIIFVDGIKGS